MTRIGYDDVKCLVKYSAHKRAPRAVPLGLPTRHPEGLNAQCPHLARRVQLLTLITLHASPPTLRLQPLFQHNRPFPIYSQVFLIAPQSLPLKTCGSPIAHRPASQACNSTLFHIVHIAHGPSQVGPQSGVWTTSCIGNGRYRM